MTAKLGITGTRHGMTEAQIKAVEEIAYWFEELHSGDCVGSDAQAHSIAKTLGLRSVGHPPSDDKLRAFCEFDEVRPEKPYLTRNRNIVSETDLLIATPAETTEQPKGGTWYTVNYARTMKKALVIIWPNGNRINWNHLTTSKEEN